MTFDQIRGNEGVVKALFGMVDAGKVPNAILLQDEDGGQAIRRHPCCRRSFQSNSGSLH